MDFRTISPTKTEDLLEFIKQNQNNHFRFGAGYTDLLPELQEKMELDLTIINLAKLKDDHFTSIQVNENGITIGSLATMFDVLKHNHLQQLPVLIEAVESLASAQIRAVATVGGNICTASPAGDVSCALTALNASCEILNTEGQIRTVPLKRFFTSVKTTVLKRTEILRSILVPNHNFSDHPVSGFIKIGERNSMEIALASLAYHFIIENSGRVSSAGIALGSVAETVQYAKTACEFISGKIFRQMTETQKEKFTDLVLDYANPISDIRASAWYRRQVLWNVTKIIL